MTTNRDPDLTPHPEDRDDVPTSPPPMEEDPLPLPPLEDQDHRHGDLPNLPTEAEIEVDNFMEYSAKETSDVIEAEEEEQKMEEIPDVRDTLTLNSEGESGGTGEVETGEVEGGGGGDTGDVTKEVGGVSNAGGGDDGDSDVHEGNTDSKSFQFDSETIELDSKSSERKSGSDMESFHPGSNPPESESKPLPSHSDPTGVESGDGDGVKEGDGGVSGSKPGEQDAYRDGLGQRQGEEREGGGGGSEGEGADGRDDGDGGGGGGGGGDDGGGGPCVRGELGGCEDEDDQVLTFQEFKQKMSQQGGAQLQRQPEDLGGMANTKKTVLANYASSDCGAKVVESNPEAQVTTFLPPPRGDHTFVLMNNMP